MATENQINANRANALKSTGPKTPEGRRNSSRNAALPGLVASTIVLQAESIRRYNNLAAALILQFQPRNSAETFLVQTMTAARWRLLRTWGLQTAGFETEMAKTRENSGDSAGSGVVLAAAAFRNLADNSRVIALLHRLEVSYSRESNKPSQRSRNCAKSPTQPSRPTLPLSSAPRLGMTMTPRMTKQNRSQC